MKRLLTLLAALLLLGCATKPAPQTTLGDLGYNVNLAHQRAVGQRNAGRIDDLHWQWIGEKYSAFRYQLEQETKAARMDFKATASVGLRKMAQDVYDEIQPHAP